MGGGESGRRTTPVPREAAAADADKRFCTARSRFAFRRATFRYINFFIFPTPEHRCPCRRSTRRSVRPLCAHRPRSESPQPSASHNTEPAPAPTICVCGCDHRRTDMDSGLTRFVVLIVLFFLLTGDLAGMVKNAFEDAGYGKQSQRHRRPAAADDRGASARKDAAPTATAANPAAAADPDLEAFGKLGEATYTRPRFGRDRLLASCT